MGGRCLAAPTSPRRPEPEYAEILEPAPLPDPEVVAALEGLELGEGREEREDMEEGREESEEGREGREEREEGEEADECLVCSERLPLVTYLPCNHRILCADCRWKHQHCSLGSCRLAVCTLLYHCTFI